MTVVGPPPSIYYYGLLDPSDEERMTVQQRGDRRYRRRLYNLRPFALYRYRQMARRRKRRQRNCYYVSDSSEAEGKFRMLLVRS